MPLLLGLLGPNIVPVYKAALSGQRIVRLVFGLLIKSDILTIAMAATLLSPTHLASWRTRLEYLGPLASSPSSSYTPRG